MIEDTPIALLVERMLAANVPHDVIVLAVQTVERKFSAILRGENAEKVERRLKADRDRKREKYELSKVSKAGGAAGHKEISEKISENSPRRIAEKQDNSFLLSSLSESQKETTKKERKKERTPTSEPREDDGWPSDYEDQLWFSFPKKRRYDRPQVMEFLMKLRRNGASWAEILAGVKSYAATDPGEYAKAPLPWLRGQRWELYSAPPPSSANTPAYLIAPPGCESLEEYRARFERENSNGQAERAGVGRNAGMGENGSD